MKSLLLAIALIPAATALAAADGPSREALLTICSQDATVRGLAGDEHGRYVAQCVKTKEDMLKQEQDDPVLAAARGSC